VVAHGGLVSYLRHPSKDQEVYLIGTVHISKESKRIVREVISHVKPGVVMVELCAARREKVVALARGQGDTVIDSLLRSAGITKETAAKFVGAGVLTSLDMYFRGNEMLAGMQAADEINAQVLLGDRDAARTMSRLREAASQLSPLEMMRMLQSSIMPQFPDNETKQVYERLWQGCAGGGEAALPCRKDLSACIAHLKQIVPHSLIEVMLTERDQHMAKQLLNCKAQRIVGCVCVCVCV